MHHHLRSRQPQVGPPRRVALALGAVAAAPGCARAWTRVVLWEWRLADLSDTAELIVSELATNAVAVSRRQAVPFFRLVLARSKGGLVILVRDFAVGVPNRQDAGDEDESGRGLLLVQAMSSRSGWYPAADGAPGKVVWATMDARPEASPSPSRP